MKGKITIIAPRGEFPGVETAAFAETEIDWWDDREYLRQRTCTTAYAATELLKYLPYEAEIVASEDIAELPSGDIIILGTADENPVTARLEEELARSLTAPDTLKNEGFRILSIEHDGRRFVFLSGRDRVGTLYAAFAYLERQGVRFTEPGVISRVEPLAECDFDITEEPDYITRGTMSSFINGDLPFLEWMAHNRFNQFTFKNSDHPYHTQKKLGISAVGGGHAISYLFLAPEQEYPYCHAIYGGVGKPLDPYPVSDLCRAPSGEGGVLTYGDAHPEWYALVDGERRMQRFPDQFREKGGAPGDNLCTTNRYMLEELSKRLIEALTVGRWKYVDYLNLWTIDNGIWCECDSCKREGNYSRRALLLAYEVDKAIKRVRSEGIINRDIKIVVPAYHETMVSPDAPLPDDFDYSTCSVIFYPIERCYLHNIDDPICKETNADVFTNLLPWGEGGNYNGDLVIGEYYNVSSFAAMPFVLTDRIIHEIPLYYSLGARHFHYMHVSARDWGFIAINNYLHGRLIWNVNADGEKILYDYFTARYGNQADAMRGIYRMIETAGANCKYYKHYQYSQGKRQALFTKLASSKPLSEQEAFPLNHMSLHKRTDHPEAGPSLEETLAGLTDALASLEAFIASASGDVLENLECDLRRLRFGVDMTRLLYLASLAKVGEATDSNIAELRASALKMENDTESMQGYDFGNNLDNAFNASWCAGSIAKLLADDASVADRDGIAL